MYLKIYGLTVTGVTRVILLLLLPLIVISCDSGGGSDSLPLGTMRAQVNGNDWRATVNKGHLSLIKVL